MGKKASRKPPPKKVIPKFCTMISFHSFNQVSNFFFRLNTKFDCPFCNNERSVDCNMDRKTGTGTVKCRICGRSFQCYINALSIPVDVFSEWIDECERANSEDAVNTNYAQMNSDQQQEFMQQQRQHQIEDQQKYQQEHPEDDDEEQQYEEDDE